MADGKREFEVTLRVDVPGHLTAEEIETRLNGIPDVSVLPGSVMPKSGLVTDEECPVERPYTEIASEDASINQVETMLDGMSGDEIAEMITEVYQVERLLTGVNNTIHNRPYHYDVEVVLSHPGCFDDRGWEPTPKWERTRGDSSVHGALRSLALYMWGSDYRFERYKRTQDAFRIRPYTREIPADDMDFCRCPRCGAVMKWMPNEPSKNLWVCQDPHGVCRYLDQTQEIDWYPHDRCYNPHDQ